MPKLPDKPSDLIHVALRDLRRCEEDKNYEICMYDWHKPHHLHHDEIKRNICEVCLAGSVMAKTLDADSKTSITPSEFDDMTADKLYALDYFRQGKITDGLSIMNLDVSEDEKDSLQRYIDDGPPIRHYEDNPVDFHNDMQAIANLLRERGL